MVQTDKWEELIRAEFCPYNLSVPMQSIQFSNEFIGGPKYRKLFVYVKDNIGYYYENFADHFIVGEHALSIFTKDKKKFKAYVSFWKKEFAKVKKLFSKLRIVDFAKKSDKELAKLLEDLFNSAIYWHGIAYNVDAIDATLNPILEKIISETHLNEKKSRLSEIYNKLTFPQTLSYMNRMNLEKLGILKGIKQKKILKNNKKLVKFVEDFHWVNFSWGEAVEITEKDVFEEAEKLNLSKIEEEFEKTELSIQIAQREKEILVKEIKITRPEILDYLLIFEEYAVFHDLRKEGQVRAVCYIRQIFDEMSKRLKVDKKLLYYYFSQELVEVMVGKKKLDINLLTRRSSEWMCEFNSNGELNEWFGEEARKERAKLIETPNSQAKELNGIGASSGRITGKARLVFSAKEAMEKIQAGEILVTGMTMPDFVPAMKIASAVVTDEGGLTCHAAIICRELGKPCVVGTKLATRTIKDGDLIEVNANHGIVKILK